MTRAPMSPREALLGAQAGAVSLPVCDHYSGVEARMRKSLQMQAELTAEYGVAVLDVTLDCEDGAPSGGESEHAALVRELVLGADRAARVAVRVHAVGHAAFEHDVQTIVGGAAGRLTHVMVPKVESVADVERAAAALDAAGATDLPLHALIESPAAVHRAFDIAAHPRIASLSFGLMDFVSAHAGAIPSAGMASHGQFSHPLVVRAKLAVASACHANGKVPSHCVVTEYQDVAVVTAAARRAAREFGYTRMWSIHPAQVRPILAAFAPDPAEVDTAVELLTAALGAGWAPVALQGRLHDRASYRYFWHILERAWRSGVRLPPETHFWFSSPAGSSGATA